jgi:hypothetical protein
MPRLQRSVTPADARCRVLNRRPNRRYPTAEVKRLHRIALRAATVTERLFGTRWLSWPLDRRSSR